MVLASFIIQIKEFDSIILVSSFQNLLFNFGGFKSMLTGPGILIFMWKTLSQRRFSGSFTVFHVLSAP